MAKHMITGAKIDTDRILIQVQFQKSFQICFVEVKRSLILFSLRNQDNDDNDGF